MTTGSSSCYYFLFNCCLSAGHWVRTLIATAALKSYYLVLCFCLCGAFLGLSPTFYWRKLDSKNRYWCFLWFVGVLTGPGWLWFAYRKSVDACYYITYDHCFCISNSCYYSCRLTEGTSRSCSSPSSGLSHPGTRMEPSTLVTLTETFLYFSSAGRFPKHCIGLLRSLQTPWVFAEAYIQMSTCRTGSSSAHLWPHFADLIESEAGKAAFATFQAGSGAAFASKWGPWMRSPWRFHLGARPSRGCFAGWASFSVGLGSLWPSFACAAAPFLWSILFEAAKAHPYRNPCQLFIRCSCPACQHSGSSWMQVGVVGKDGASFGCHIQQRISCITLEFLGLVPCSRWWIVLLPLAFDFSGASP